MEVTPYGLHVGPGEHSGYPDSSTTQLRRSPQDRLLVHKEIRSLTSVRTQRCTNHTAQRVYSLRAGRLSPSRVHTDAAGTGQ